MQVKLLTQGARAVVARGRGSELRRHEELDAGRLRSLCERELRLERGAAERGDNDVNAPQRGLEGGGVGVIDVYGLRAIGDSVV